MSIDAVADGARWVLAIVFVLSAIEKASTLHSRTAAWHPVMVANPRLRAWAPQLLLTSLLADVAAIILVAFEPRLGGSLALLLMLIYTPAGTKVQGGGCRCFWAWFNTTTRQALVLRNLILLILASLVAAVDPHLSIVGIGWGVAMLIALLVSTRALSREPEVARVASTMTEGN